MEIAKAGLAPREIAKRALNLACLPCSFGFSAFIWRILIIRASNARSCAISACSNTCDRIVRKRRKILSRTSVFKFKI